MTTYALIDPNIFYKNDKNKLVIQYIEKDRGAFEVAPPFYWIECPDDINRDLTYYDLITKEFVIISVEDLFLKPIE